MKIIKQDGSYSVLEDVDKSLKDITRIEAFWDVNESDCYTPNQIDGTGYLYRRTDEGIKVLTGFLSSIDSTYSYPKIDLGEYKLNPILRPNQREAIEKALEETRGIIKMPTGIGKAFVAVELCRIFLEAGHRSVICVATRALLYQMKDELIKYGVPADKIGLVGDGNKETDKPVIAGIADSLAIEGNYDETLLNQASLLIFDESHCYQNKTGLAISHYMSKARYRIGLSATPFISNGMENVLIGICGPLIYECSEEEAINQGIIMKPKVLMYEAPSAWAPPALLSRPYSHFVYNKLYGNLILNNEGRNKLIAKLAIEYMNRKAAPLVIIVSKINTNPNHPQRLHPLIKEGGYDLPIISGTSSKKVMTKTLEDLRSFSIPGAICGPGIMKMGVNIKSLGCVVLAGAGSSDVDLIQRVGRALRSDTGKEQPIIIDFKDKKSFFASQSMKRLETYKSTYGLDSVEVINEDD